jgi:putative Ca2+/H+ antiporter (TMEM165/GDT1 family)
MHLRLIDPLSSFPVVLASSFSLIGLAEIGDKSQLVCMALAARYRAWPVLLGAIGAFALLNLAAVVFGAAVAHWLPERVVAAVVAVLFILFGIHALRSGVDEEDESVAEKGSHSIFVSTFLLIGLAELGDKTQIAVAGLGGTANPTAVWLGATLALAATSGLGVWAGRTILQRIPIVLLHRLSGALFLLFGFAALATLFW